MDSILNAAGRSYSQRLYARLKPENARLFRYLLEAYDNLAFTSVTARKDCILKVVFSPDQAQEVREALREMRQSLEFELIDLN